MMPNDARLSLQQKCNLVTLWLFGEKVTAIAQHFGIATSSVTRTVENMGYRTAEKQWSRRLRAKNVENVDIRRSTV